MWTDIIWTWSETKYQSTQHLVAGGQHFLLFWLGHKPKRLAVLIYAIEKSNGNASAVPHANNTVCKNQLVNVYTTVIFSVMNADCGKMKANPETKKIYAAVTAFVQEYWSNTDESGHAHFAT
ncbi:hypothetical protein ILYODFUR_023336 [Ilyodon furcidens]|uniref:Uncharacterized protein n=1 Tax=Ilyodon furcidens TaxID=33524 RepID=A0ABV0UVS9_9TELE